MDIMETKLIPVLVLSLLIAFPAGGEERPRVGNDAERAWQQQLTDGPDRFDIRWRLMRAIYYRGEFEAAGPEKDAAWSEGRDLAVAGIARLADLGAGTPPHELEPGTRQAWVSGTRLDPSDLARFYFWSSIHLGSWSRTAGLLTAVREGVANRIHAYLGVTLELDPAYDRGGPHRLLSALHASLPRVPFVTGWVDRTQALPQAERALAIAPDDPGNRFLWALTVAKQQGPSEATQAVFEEIAQLEPRPGFEQEDAALRQEALKRLEETGPA